MMNKLILAVILLTVFIKRINGIMSVTQVKAGEQVTTLACLSNDDDHRFMFWQLENKNIVGPGNNFDENKYNYEVLSGKLFIWSITSKEEGIYQCVSRGIKKRSAYNVHTVELIILKDSNVRESDFEMNLLWGLTAVMIVVVLVAAILIFVVRKQKRSRKMLDLQEVRTYPTKYQSHTTTVRIPDPANQGIDNDGLDVDFPKVFKHHSSDQVIP